jgi:hypothetical protein
MKPAHHQVNVVKIEAVNAHPFGVYTFFRLPSGTEGWRHSFGLPGAD